MKCKNCVRGVVIIPEIRITKEMAIDSGFPEMEGEIYEPQHYENCPCCDGYYENCLVCLSEA